MCLDRLFISVRFMSTLRFPEVGTCMRGPKYITKFEGEFERAESQIVGN